MGPHKRSSGAAAGREKVRKRPAAAVAKKRPAVPRGQANAATSSHRKGRAATASANNKEVANFEVLIDRSKCYSVKHGLHFSTETADPIPLWVADMDLPICPKIQEALRLRTEHPTFGYTYQPGEIWNLVITWLEKQQGWSNQKLTTSDFIFSPSVVTAFACALKAFTDIGDAVLVMTPLYSPLQKAIEGEGRRLVRHCLAESTKGESDYEYCIDWNLLEAQLESESPRLLLLCNPHNPSGRVWRRTELQKLADLCAANKVLVVSDEIHADWCLWGHDFVPFADVAEDKVPVVTLGAPTKTWNLAGLHCSFLIVRDEQLRQKYLKVVEHAFLHFGSTFATEAMLAAYRYGASWLTAAKAYVEGNINEVLAYIDAHLPEIKAWRPQATFLVWLDCSKLGLTGAELTSMLRHAGVVLSPGEEFAPEADRFQRMNVAHARVTLMEALRRISAAVEKLRLDRK